MTKRIGIFGASGMAREVQDVAQEQGYSTVFVVRTHQELIANSHLGDVITESDVCRYKDMPFSIGIGDSYTRKKIHDKFSGVLSFENLVHPSVTFGYKQKKVLEKNIGLIICAGVRFSNNVSIGDFSIFNFNSTISHDVIIGDFVTISPGATILGNVEIKQGSWIGAGVVINQGNDELKTIIGENAVIGSGGVVLNSCEPNSVYVGVPVRRIR